MDRKEYLNEISAAARPVTSKRTNKLLSSKIFWIIFIGIVLFAIIAIVGSAISGSGNSLKDRLSALLLHIDNTSEVIKEYQPSIKSSELRSYSASLSGILSDTGSKLTTYVSDKYDFKIKDAKTSIVEEETSAKDLLISDLFTAKINGTLDRIYAQKLAYDISLITSREAQILDSSSDSTLTDIITTSYNSLATLYDNFNNFSESK